mgnify:CR=1
MKFIIGSLLLIFGFGCIGYMIGGPDNQFLGVASGFCIAEAFILMKHEILECIGRQKS